MNTFMTLFIKTREVKTNMFSLFDEFRNHNSKDNPMQYTYYTFPYSLLDQFFNAKTKDEQDDVEEKLREIKTKKYEAEAELEKRVAADMLDSVTYKGTKLKNLPLSEVVELLKNPEYSKKFHKNMMLQKTEALRDKIKKKIDTLSFTELETVLSDLESKSKV